FHLSSIGNLTGFLIAAVGAYLAVAMQTTISSIEKVFIILAVLVLLAQSILWITIIKRNRKINYHFLNSLIAIYGSNKDKAVQSADEVIRIQTANNKIERVLDILVYASITLVLCLILLRVWFV